MMIVTAFLIFLPGLIAAQQFDDSVFTVVAPFTIRQGKPYNIYIRGFNLDKTISLTIRIVGRNDNGADVDIEKGASLTPSVPRASLKILTETITKGTYSLIVEAENYSQKRNLTYSSTKYVFMVQFNKALYIPSDTLQYRIFAIDSDTNAVNPKEANSITIIDPKRNIVDSLKNVKFAKGKYENKFQLAPKTSFGNWTLRFESGDETVQKEFIVAEYKLPLVKGKLTVPQYTSYDEEKVPITIEISYAFKRNPVGIAKVNFFKYREKVLEKNIQINSMKTTFDVDIKTELQITSNYGEYFEVFLNFEDPLTKEKIIDVKSFNIASKIYYFDARGYKTDYINPGHPFSFKVTMKKYDGSPAQSGTKIQVTSITFPNVPKPSPTNEEQTLILGADGSIISSIDVPLDTDYLEVRFSADNADSGYIYAKPNWHKTGSFLEIQIDERKCNYESECLKLNKPVSMKLTSGEEIELAVVHIIAKGVLLKTLILNFDSDLNEGDDAKTVYFTFIPTISYTPIFKIIAYYIDSNGNFVVGRAEFKLMNDLSNYLKIKASAKDVKPGSDAKISIESYVYSTVSLAAIDQRAFLLNSNGNISKDSIFNDLHKFHWNNFKYDWKNIRDYEYNFADMGLLVFTNINQETSNETSSDNPKSADALSLTSSFGTNLLNDAQSSSHIHIREDFKETFLWRDVDVLNSIYEDDDYTDAESQFGYESIVEKVPDSISNYYVYGISMSSTKGLGLSENFPSISVFMPFFISAEFPFSIKRNEILLQDIIIYNYLTEVQTVEVKIKSDPGYEAVDLANNGWSEIEGFYTKVITTVVGEHINLQFSIKPSIIGYIQLEITARGALAGDGLQKQLRVIPEGFPRSITRNVLIPVENPKIQIKETLQCDLPPSAYQDTTEISATVTGDLFGKALANIQNLIKFPSGCCEQIASALIPNIVAYFYLLSANKLTPDLKKTLETNIAAGYQNLLNCQKSDGSYSIFANGAPSIWVTSYIIQYLNIASDIVTVDPDIITKGADYLASQQNTNGSFVETGQVNYYNMQAGTQKGVALTAFCSIFFTSLLEKYPQYKDVRDKSVAFLESQFNSESSTFELGIVAYALQKAGSIQADSAYDLFYTSRTETISTIFWETEGVQKGFQYSALAPDIEVTSYGLMTLLIRNEPLKKILKIVQYIVSQGNLFGGFGSSQDTVVALNAISQFSKVYALNGAVTIAMTPNVGSDLKAKVTQKNALTLQTFQLDPATRFLILKASSTSSGLVIVSLTCKFYEDPSKVIPQFDITYEFSRACKNDFNMKICFKYIPSGSSNMALLVVTMPSGFQGSGNGNDARLIEITNQQSEFTFYFDSVNNVGTCVEIYGYRKMYVADLRDVQISAFDYYDTSKQGVISYSFPESSTSC